MKQQTFSDKLNTQLTIAITTLVGWISVGTISFHLIEDWTWIQSFYFSVITLTTVGYGDLYPTTDPSRLFTAFYVLLGVTIVLASLGIIGKKYLDQWEEQFLARKAKEGHQQKKLHTYHKKKD